MANDVIFNSTYKEALKRVGRTAFTVFIDYNYDLGEPQWAVIDGADNDSNGFWFDSFDSKEEAVAFCEEMGWIVERVSDEHEWKPWYILLDNQETEDSV